MKSIKNRPLVILIIVIVLIASIILIDNLSGGIISKKLKGNGNENVAPKAEISSQLSEVSQYDLIYYYGNKVALTKDGDCIVYDLKSNKIVGSIDLAQYGYIYDGSKNIDTQFITDKEGTLWIYKEKDDKKPTLWGFDLKNIKKGEIKPEESYDLSKDTGKSKLLALQNENIYSYGNTYDMIPEAVASGIDNTDYLYSRLTIKEDIDTTKYLYLKENVRKKKVYLCQYNIETEKNKETRLFLNDFNKNMKLPKFEYTGEDSLYKAIFKYMEQDNDMKVKSGQSVYIASPVVVDIIKLDGEIKVFGNYYGGIYELDGNIIKLLKVKNNLGVISFTYNKQDGYIFKSAKFVNEKKDMENELDKIAGDYYQVRQKLYDSNSKWPDVEKEYIKMYDKNNKLGIVYVKHFNLEPIKVK